jgi:hypothetical protein
MVFDDEVVLNSINLYINDKEFLTLLGPTVAARRPPCVSSVVFRSLPPGMCFSTV